MKTPTGVAAALLVCVLAGPALAQVQPTMTMEQAETLSAVLLAIDRGSTDQCPPAQNAKDQDPKAPERPCPFHRNVPLIKAMAQDIVALKQVDEKFKLERDAVNAEAFAAFPSPLGATSDVAIKEIEAQRNQMISTKILPLYDEKVVIMAPLVLVSMKDLNLGDPPDHNLFPAEWLAALSPLISDFTAAGK